MEDLPTALARFDVRAEVDVRALDDLQHDRQRRRSTALAVAAAALLVLPAGLVVAELPDTVPSAQRIAESDPPNCLSTTTGPSDPIELARLSFADSRDGRLPVDLPVRTDDGDRNRGGGLWVTQTSCRPFGEGTTVVEGHRTIYGASLYDLPIVEPGDRIEVLPSDGASRTYVVVRVATLDADQDPAALVSDDPRRGSHIVLTTAAPAFTADRQQLVVHASLDATAG